jgi:Tol biopolymer transport system component
MTKANCFGIGAIILSCILIIISCGAKSTKTTALKIPTAPSNLTGHALSASKILLTWQDQSINEDTFVIYRNVSGNWTQIGFTLENITSFTDSLLQDSTSYSYQVSAKNEDGESTPTSSITISTVASNHPPSVPSNPNPANGSIGIAIDKVLQWTCNDQEHDTIHYDIYLDNNQSPVLRISNITSCFYHPETLLYDTHYYWKIKARDIHGLEVSSPLWDFRTSSPPSQIAFTNFYSGGAKIYIVNSDGSNLHAITEDSLYCNHPSWSPDGTQIAYAQAAQYPSQIYIMNSDGSNKHILSNTVPVNGNEPAWSPDGLKIAFVSQRDGNAEIYIININGTNLRRLTNNTELDQLPAWSPDGSKIAFSSSRINHCGLIFVMEADGSNQHNITPYDIAAGDYEPDWSPDGTKIVYYSTDNIWVMNADGTNRESITDQTITDYVSPSWSPDGTQITCGSNYNYQFDIFVMNADGSNQHAISHLPGDDEWMAWKR